MDTLVCEIIEQVPVVSVQSINKEVDQIFQGNKSHEGIVVVENLKPIGLVMKSKFYQKIGTQYGFNVHMGRSVMLTMSSVPLIVDEQRTIPEVCVEAMNRPQDQLYDFVIITREGNYIGVTSIRNLLLAFAEVQTQLARDLNPLTGLPGNRQIDQQLRATLIQPFYSILYLDLDRFKEYNDTYGFKKGDYIIQKTADLVKESLLELGLSESFFGHIGGDDFILLLPHHNYQPVCRRIITEFDQSLKNFYSPEHLLNGYMIGQTRDGKVGEIHLTAISIAVITNESYSFKTIEDVIKAASLIKKKCKKDPSSCFLKMTKEDVVSLAYLN
jgi:diguanylate cyclase (GGDEF)-like protein